MINRLLTLVTVMCVFISCAQASGNYIYEEPSAKTDSGSSMLRSRDAYFEGLMVPHEKEHMFIERFPGVAQTSPYIKPDSMFAYLISAATGYQQHASWNLPFDLTVYIARQLDNDAAKSFALVCKCFSNAANYRPNLRFSPLVTTHAIITIMRTKRAIRSLGLALDDYNNGVWILGSVSRFFPRLENLDLSKCKNLDIKTIQNDVALPQMLTSLGLPAFKINNSKELVKLAEQYPCLTALSLTKCSTVDEAVLTQLACLCPGLKSLSFLDGFSRINPRDLILDTDLLVSLTSLDLRGSQTINSGQVAEIILSRPRLKSLKLKGHNQITYQTMDAVGQFGNSLEVLKLSVDQDISSRDFAQYVQWSRGKITSLQIVLSGLFYEDSLNTVAENCQNLKSLMLVSSSLPVTKVLKSFSSLCPELRKLNLSNCKSIASDELVNAASHCHKLTKLILAFCGEINSDAIVLAAKMNPNLMYLSLRGCHDITGKAILRILDYCPKLRYLDLSMCGEITRSQIESMIKNRPILSVEVFRKISNYDRRNN